MEFNQLIKERYSVRKFKPDHINKREIAEIISASHLAPTGCNYQPQRILILNTDESMNKLKKCTKCHFNAPCAMLVCYNKNETWQRPYDGALSAPVDASIIATHIILKAYDMGIGSCWVMHFNPELIKEEFNIPENIEPHALIVMGYPAEDSTPLNLHFEYRPLEDVVYYEKF